MDPGNDDEAAENVQRLPIRFKPQAPVERTVSRHAFSRSGWRDRAETLISSNSGVFGSDGPAFARFRPFQQTNCKF